MLLWRQALAQQGTRRTWLIEQALENWS